MTRKISESLFTSILYLFSSSMLILSLLMSIKLNAISDQVRKTEKEVNSLQKENAALAAELESLTNMETIDEFARKAGMVKCSSKNVEKLVLTDIE